MTRSGLTKAFALLLVLLVTARAQLVLDDVVEPDDVQDPDAKQQEATNPLTRMLQWGVDNTDKDSLAERARAIREGRSQPQKVDREVMEAMFGTKISMLQESVKNLNSANEANEEETLIDALESLEYHCSDIDNANDLDAVGGLSTVLDLMSHSSNAVRTAALWVIGTMAQSNPKGQEMLMSKGVLSSIFTPLKAVIEAGTAKEADPKLIAKALYATSTLVRGCAACLQSFESQQGSSVIANLLFIVNKSTEQLQWLAVKRKLTALISDLIVEDSNLQVSARLAKSFASSSSSSQASVVRDVVSFLETDDRELHEKSIDTLSALLQAVPPSVEAMNGARLPQLLQLSIANAQKKMASAQEGDESWEEVSLAGESLLSMLRNSSATKTES
mmetsp:Transcript_11420/g.17984  ORF Transcript_11420/g.17984 Transcript_11420/m.17984 type:complete len:389 (+) Transcript_11420:97-1263(+)|eukprot:CAMPEP_0184318494 /NCGR_PEP_ID=MMETSP1049-20130417/102869_1 /TAXON_ID=77928 /ORGANISM="Proteomonas sulcata, Strain CCMP704" /LENGTH=388 /DNA_ID=CAMNT_0026638277 /DNA_START=89 /DNA_END=1255 /DNA_ORIENTATION=-